MPKAMHNYFIQAEAARRWFEEEIKRLKAAGYTVIGDTVIMEKKSDAKSE